MKIETTPNGNLTIVAEPDDMEMLRDLRVRTGEDDLLFMDELLEETGLSGNGVLMRVSPEDVGGLTEAPIVTDDRTIEDDGKVVVNGSVWWFPNYMVENFADTLIAKGCVTFTLADEVPTVAMAPEHSEGTSRVEALPKLQQQAGAAYTLYQIANKALQDASGDAMAVDWAQVHQDVFAKAVGQDKQPVGQVLDAIKLHSPGAVTQQQIAAVDAMGEQPLTGEYIELVVTLRSKTTAGTDKETIRVWDGQSVQDTAQRIAQGYGAEVVEIHNLNGSLYVEPAKAYMKANLDALGIQHFGTLPKGWDAASQELISAVADGENTQGFLLATIGREHFGNPIPRPWYDAAQAFLKLRQVELQVSNEQQQVTWSGSLDKAVAIGSDGSKVAIRFGNEVSKVGDVFGRLAGGEMGDDLPIVMEAFGCDYDSACNAVFEQKFDVATAMLQKAVDAGVPAVETTGEPKKSTAVKKDYVVLVGGGVGRRWLSHDSIEDDGEPSTYPPSTTDPEMVLRSTSHSEIQKILKATVKRYPANEFRVDVLDPIEVGRPMPKAQKIAQDNDGPSI